MLVMAVQVNAIVVHLPNLHERVAERLPAAIENSSGQVRDLANGQRERVVDDEQIIVCIQRKVVGIKWSFGLSWRAQQFLGKGARDCTPCGAQGQPTEKLSAGMHQS